MAFLLAPPISKPVAFRGQAAASSTNHLRLSTFIPAVHSLRGSPAWSNVRQPSPTLPLVIRAPTLASVTVSNPPPPHILISGAPASGKGTQCEYVVDKYDVVHISTGDMLRSAVKKKTTLGVKAKSYMDEGGLVPDDIVISMLKERIAQDDCARKGWLLDGFPRTVVQAEALTDANILPDAVVVLDVEDDVLIERVVGRRTDPETGKIYHLTFGPPTDPEVIGRLTQRSDDTEEKARVRLENYYTHARSIQEHYASMLSKVDGNRDKAVVFRDISAIIDTSLAGDDTDGKNDDPLLAAVAPANIGSEENESTKGIPVAEFVRRAEEAYEKGILTDEDVNWSGQAGADSPDSAGTSGYGDLGRRLDLVFGDTLALLTFAYIGRASHGDKSLSFGVVQTAAPFIAAWLATSPLLGAYTRAATENVPATLKSFARSWAVAVPMGIGLRGKLSNENICPSHLR